MCTFKNGGFFFWLFQKDELLDYQTAPFFQVTGARTWTPMVALAVTIGTTAREEGVVMDTAIMGGTDTTGVATTTAATSTNLKTTTGQVKKLNDYKICTDSTQVVATFPS